MGVFNKRGDEFIDYTLLYKRGLLKQKEQALKDKVGSDGVLDFTTVGSSGVNQGVANPFDMLSNLASSSSPSSSFPSSTSSSSDSDVNSLKLKIEDIEYKLERLLERIARVDSRLDELGR